MEGLNNDIMERITASLENRDIVALSMASKNMMATYPRDICLTFCADDTQQYVTFALWVMKRSIQSIRVRIDVDIWNDVMPLLWDGVFIPEVELHPVDLSDIRKTPWIPACNAYASGFASSECIMPVYDRNNLYLYAPQTFDNADTVPLPVPQIHPEACVNEIWCSGTFSRLDRLPLDKRLMINHCVVTQDEWEHLSRCETHLGILSCNTQYITHPLPIQATILDATCDALHIISAMPRCTKVTLELEGDLDLGMLMTPVYPSVEHVSLFGYCSSCEVAVRLLKLSFPNAKHVYSFDLI
jgi:hypothetical protein